MAKSIDMRGIFGAFIQMAGLKLGTEEWRVLLFLIGKSGMEKGKKIRKNLNEVSRYTRIDRNNLKRAIKGLKDKNLLEESGFYFSLFPNPNRKDAGGVVVLPPSLYFLKFLAQAKGIQIDEWVEPTSLLDNELDYGFFDQFFADPSQTDGMSRVNTTTTPRSSTPYIDNINIGTNSDEFGRSKIPSPRAASQKASGGESPLGADENNPPEKPGLSLEQVDGMIAAGSLEVGKVTYYVIKAFIELGDNMNMKRIEQIRAFVKEIVDVFELLESDGKEKEGATAWCQQQILAWKLYYSREDNREKLKDYFGSLITFFNNAKKLK